MVKRRFESTSNCIDACLLVTGKWQPIIGAVSTVLANGTWQTAGYLLLKRSLQCLQSVLIIAL